MPQEIERKFIISKIPNNLESFEKKMIYQNYLAVSSEEEVRTRLEDEDGNKKYDVTYKKGKGLSREEIKFGIDKSIYFQLSCKIQEKPIIKYRQFYHLDKYQLMIDTYTETKEILIIAEIEFNTEEEANLFEPPIWFGKEVTYNSEFKNKRLWQRLQKGEL